MSDKTSNVNTINDWMDCLAEAMNECDMEIIYDLRLISRNWVQPALEREAQMNLLDAAENLIDEVED